MVLWRVVAASLAIALVVAYAIGSGRWVSTASSWYLSLEQPSWQPPPVVFGLAWTYNFTALAVVGVVLSWTATPARVTAFLASLALTIALALTWAYLFYGPHALVGAAVALTACALLTLVPLVIAFAERGWLGVLLVPYALWLVIASSLSWGYVALDG